MRKDYLKICKQLSNDTFKSSDQQQTSADKQSLICQRFTQVLILMAATFLYDDKNMAAYDDLKKDVSKEFPEPFPPYLRDIAQQMVEEIKQANDPQWPYIAVRYETCVRILTLLVEESHTEGYPDVEQVRLETIAGDIGNSIAQLWHVIRHGE